LHVGVGEVAICLVAAQRIQQVAGEQRTGGLLRLAVRGAQAERRRQPTTLGLGAPDRKTQKTTRALLTGYLLYALGGDKTYRDFADPDVQLSKTLPMGDEAAPLSPEEKFVALLKG
jgi:DNA mismatch repair protein MutH